MKKLFLCFLLVISNFCYSQCSDEALYKEAIESFHAHYKVLEELTKATPTKDSLRDHVYKVLESRDNLVYQSQVIDVITNYSATFKVDKNSVLYKSFETLADQYYLLTEAFENRMVKLYTSKEINPIFTEVYLQMLNIYYQDFVSKKTEIFHLMKKERTQQENCELKKHLATTMFMDVYRQILQQIVLNDQDHFLDKIHRELQVIYSEMEKYTKTSAQYIN